MTSSLPRATSTGHFGDVWHDWTRHSAQPHQSPVSSLLRPGSGAEYCDQLLCLSVCVSVCLSASIYLESLDRSSQIFMRIPCGCGSVLLWRRCDVMHFRFGRSGPYGDAWKAKSLNY